MSTPASHIWKPSSARLVRVDSFIAIARGTTAVSPAPLNWPAKDPGDILDYVLDISPAIVGNDGDGVATLDISITPTSPGDLTIQSSIADGSRIILWLSAGQAGTVYTINFIISTLTGRSLQRSVLLPVLFLSSPQIPPTALLMSGGLPLIDQNGNPVVAGS